MVPNYGFRTRYETGTHTKPTGQVPLCVAWGIARAAPALTVVVTRAHGT